MSGLTLLKEERIKKQWPAEMADAGGTKRQYDGGGKGGGKRHKGKGGMVRTQIAGKANVAP